MLTEPIAVTLLMVTALEKLGIPYFIGGSLATAIHGVARATMDVDLVADMRIEHADTLVQILGDDFYADVEMIRDAIIHQHSFNVIHQETMFKVDVFIRKSRPFDQAQFERRRKYVLSEDPERATYFATPEDNVLAKLEWYRMGGEVSDRQWGDVLNVLKIQGERLDLDYLRKWAAELSVTDLLERAFREAR
ncbi:MAG: hypothetical protein ABIG63_04655 [Chloroflexota bacterium]